jgi:hypothetical protein
MKKFVLLAFISICVLTVVLFLVFKSVENSTTNRVVGESRISQPDKVTFSWQTYSEDDTEKISAIQGPAVIWFRPRFNFHARQIRRNIETRAVHDAFSKAGIQLFAVDFLSPSKPIIKKYFEEVGANPHDTALILIGRDGRMQEISAGENSESRILNAIADYCSKK